MDKYEKCSEAIMKLGDSIIAEKKRKATIIKRAAISFSGLCAAAIVGIFALHNAPPAPERVSELSEVISADITTSGMTSAAVTTVSETSEIKTIRTTISSAKTSMTTTAKATEATTTAALTEITAADTTSQAAYTIAVPSAVQSTAVSTESSIVSSQSGSTSASTSSTSAVSRSEPFVSVPVSGTASDTATSEITTTTFIEPKHYNTASIPSNKLSDIIGYGKEIVYEETVYTSDFLDYSTEIIDDEIGEYGNIPIYSLKMFSPRIKLTLGINNKFYSFSNKNYSAKDLNEFCIDIGWERSGNYIEYEMNGISGEKADYAINDILFADAEMSEYSESAPSLSEKQAAIYSNSPFTAIVYENGYLQVQVNSKNIYFQIGEEKAMSFFEYID